MKLTIEVTAEDIAKGEKRSCNKCPIVLAARRVLDARSVRGVTQIQVTKGYLKLCRRNSIEFYRLPDAAYQFYVAFDEGESTKPLTFEVELEDTLHLCASGPVGWAANGS